jgi:hypothetical protein
MDDGTIRTSRGKACCKPPFLTRQLSVFSAPTKYRVVKIVCPTSSGLILKMNKCYNGVSRELEKFTW